MMTIHNIWEAIITFYEPTLEIMTLWSFGLPLFVTVIAVMFICSQKLKGPFNLRALKNAAFPTEQYDHASSRVDMWNGIILLLLGFPLVGVIAINGIAIDDVNRADRCRSVSGVLPECRFRRVLGPPLVPHPPVVVAPAQAPPYG